MVASFYAGTTPTDEGIKNIDDYLEDTFGDSKRNYYGSYTGGTSSNRLTSAAMDLYGLTTATPVGWSLNDLQKEVKAGRPPIVGVWTNMVIDHTRMTSVEHWMVVTEISDTVVRVNDPGHSSPVNGGQATYSIEKFLAAWNDQENAVLVIYPNSEQGPTLLASQPSFNQINSSGAFGNGGYVEAFGTTATGSGTFDQVNFGSSGILKYVNLWVGRPSVDCTGHISIRAASNWDHSYWSDHLDVSTLPVASVAKTTFVWQNANALPFSDRGLSFLELAYSKPFGGADTNCIPLIGYTDYDSYIGGQINNDNPPHSDLAFEIYAED